MGSVKNLPEWLKKNYNDLWEEYHKKEFTVEKVIDSLNVSENMALKTLWQLEKKGFLLKTRSEIDYRNKIYRLIPPDDVRFVIGIYSLLEEDRYKEYTLEDKLRLINEKISYVLTGSHAAYEYHRYLNPPKVYEIKVYPNDEGKWIAFLTDEDTRVFLDNVIQTRSARNYIKLVNTNFNIANIRKKTESGIYIEKIEYLLLELLNRETETSIKEIVAIIIKNLDIINWFGDEGLTKIITESNDIRRLGFILEVINYESESRIIDENIIKNLQKAQTDSIPYIFPKDDVLLERYNDLRNKLSHRSLITEEEIDNYRNSIEKYQEYSKLGAKWGILSILPRHIIRKVLMDMGVKVCQMRDV